MHCPSRTRSHGDIPPASWQEIENALYGELDYVEQHLLKYPDYCILNLCRLIYSFETREVVVSKTRASVWAYETFPQWRKQINLARKSYAGHATPVYKQRMLSEIGRFLEFAQVRIEQVREVKDDNARQQPDMSMLQ